MGRPRFAWWGYVKWVIRDQPVKCRELAEMQRAGGYAQDGTPRSTEAKRTTEERALRGFAGQKAREFDAVERAVERTRQMKTGDLRLRIIDLVFWQQSHTLHGAALRCHVSYDTAQNWHGDFIRLVARYMGFIGEN